ncbi:hypothetical protein HGM15179_018891, partial [Zosterops borbonicus]
KTTSTAHRTDEDQKIGTEHVVADTGADVTIIALSEWPQGWELVPANEVISGIGGAAMSMQNKRTILNEGPKSQVATVRPFVDVAQGGFQARTSSRTSNCQMQHPEMLFQNLKESKKTRFGCRGGEESNEE